MRLGSTLLSLHKYRAMKCSQHPTRVLSTHVLVCVCLAQPADLLKALVEKFATLMNNNFSCSTPKCVDNILSFVRQWSEFQALNQQCSLWPAGYSPPKKKTDIPPIWLTALWTEALAMSLSLMATFQKEKERKKLSAVLLHSAQRVRTMSVARAWIQECRVTNGWNTFLAELSLWHLLSLLSGGGTSLTLPRAANNLVPFLPFDTFSSRWLNSLLHILTL